MLSKFNNPFRLAYANDLDAFIPEVDSFAGVATYLAQAREGKVNLFI